MAETVVSRLKVRKLIQWTQVCGDLRHKGKYTCAPCNNEPLSPDLSTAALLQTTCSGFTCGSGSSGAQQYRKCNMNMEFVKLN